MARERYRKVKYRLLADKIAGIGERQVDKINVRLIR
jgi:hypothetical protein